MSAKSTPGHAAFQILCPHLTCRKVLAIPHDVRGQVVRCVHCQNLLRVPEAGPRRAPATDAA